MTIRKEGRSFVLRAKRSGKVLGRHETKAQAREQERAIKASQARRKRLGSGAR